MSINWSPCSHVTTPSPSQTTKIFGFHGDLWLCSHLDCHSWLNGSQTHSARQSPRHHWYNVQTFNGPNFGVGMCEQAFIHLSHYNITYSTCGEIILAAELFELITDICLQHIEVAKGASATLCGVPLCLPRYFYQSLQSTNIKVFNWWLQVNKRVFVSFTGAMRAICIEPK